MLNKNHETVFAYFCNTQKQKLNRFFKISKSKKRCIYEQFNQTLAKTAAR